MLMFIVVVVVVVGEKEPFGTEWLLMGFEYRIRLNFNRVSILSQSRHKYTHDTEPVTQHATIRLVG